MFPKTRVPIYGANAVTADIQALLREAIVKNRAVGAAVGFIEQKEIRFFYYGKKSIQNDEPVSVDTIFEIGSIMKVFTTLLLMDMSAKGVVDLEEPIVLPDGRIP